jgi:hypothetical protein
VERLVGDVALVACGASTGNLLALGLNLPAITRTVSVEPFLRAANLESFIAFSRGFLAPPEGCRGACLLQILFGIYADGRLETATTSRTSFTWPPTSSWAARLRTPGGARNALALSLFSRLGGRWMSMEAPLVGPAGLTFPRKKPWSRRQGTSSRTSEALFASQTTSRHRGQWASVAFRPRRHCRHGQPPKRTTRSAS